MKKAVQIKRQWSTGSEGNDEKRREKSSAERLYLLTSEAIYLFADGLPPNQTTRHSTSTYSRTTRSFHDSGLLVGSTICWGFADFRESLVAAVKISTVYCFF